MPSNPRKLISFDWSIKKILRSKANFAVLEGFLSELLFDDITIKEVLEGESNKNAHDDKYNRLDIKVKNAKDEIVIIEIQYNRELDYLKCSEEEKREYERYKESLHAQASMYESTYVIGKMEGRLEGKLEGKIEGKLERTLEIAKALKAKGVAPEVIVAATGLTPAEIDRLNR